MKELSINFQNNNPFISVIVPVYNVEKYLKECLDSLINQTYKNIEIIVVDDGSTDSSKKICDDYAAEDKRFQVIHQKNGGLSDARNTGIKAARGKYLLFVDSDDLLADYSVIQNLAVLLQRTKAVITYCPFVIRFHDVIPIVSEQSSVGKKNNIDVLTPNELLAYAKKNHTSLAAWSFIVTRDYILNNQLYFRKGIVHEDIEWIPRLLYSEEEQNVNFFNKPFYLYRYNPCSITSSLTQYRCDSMYLIFSELSERMSVSPKYAKKFLRNWFNRYLYFLFIFFENDCIENTVFFYKNIGNLKQIFKNNHKILNTRNRILYIFIQTYPKMFFILRRVARRG